ncbi:MAG TPA: flagellar biosynthesis anti-sigma factor FlgM [Myxococcales bacterium]|nr:flagellar biosynthesis anti-sigma factor FlgM [Myxococcales bacterium]
MKIRDTSSAPPASAESHPAAPRPAATEPADTIATSATGQLTAAIASAAAGVQDARTARLAEIKAQIKAGTYQPDPSAIADQILDQAVIDARLQAMLKG